MTDRLKTEYPLNLRFVWGIKHSSSVPTNINDYLHSSQKKKMIFVLIFNTLSHLKKINSDFLKGHHFTWGDTEKKYRSAIVQEESLK